MASTYSTNLKIELQATGENSGTWGTITNTNLGTALEQAIVGYGNPNYASDANLTLTYTDTNAAQAARALVLNVTSGVSLTGTRELVVPTIQKQYIVQNNTTGSQSITVKTSAGTGITVPNGRKAHLYVDGTNVIYMDDYVDINGGAIDGTPIGANSAAAGTFTTVGATTGNITTVNATTVDTTNIEVTNLKAKDGTAAGSIADSTGVVTLGSSVLTTTDINGGTIDGTTIGGSSAAAGTFTTLTSSSTVTVNGGTANQVQYLNASKQQVGSANLTFDGTTLTAANFADSSLTSGRVTYAGASGNLTDSASLTFDGTTLATTTVDATNVEVTNIKAKDGTAAASIADSTGVISLTSNPTLSGGTANGVLYLNGSKVATSGSALTFDGTNFINTSGYLGTTQSGATSSYYIAKNSVATSGVVFGAHSSGAGYIDVINNNPLFFAVNDTEQMRLTSTGLGIGTSSPGSKLSVIGDATIRPASGYNFYFENSGTTARINYLNNAFSANISAAYRATDFAWQKSDGAEVLKLDSSGNLGIGTTSPGQKLTVQGGLNVTSSATLPAAQGSMLFSYESAVNRCYMGDGTGYSFAFSKRVSSTTTDLVTILDSGNVGIGTTSSPTRKLQVNGDIRIEDTFSLFMGVGAEQKIFVAGSSANTYLTFNQWTGSAYTERMRLDASGNLGLGVTPSAWGSILKPIQLGNAFSYVAGRTDGVRQVWLGSNSYYNGTNWIYGLSSPAAQYYQNDGIHVWNTAPSGTAGNTISFTQAMTLGATGRLDLTPGSGNNAYIECAGGTNTAGSSSFLLGQGAGSNEGYVWNRANSYVAFGTNNTERARITSGGDLLVGTTTALGKFTVLIDSASVIAGSFENNAATPTAAGLLVNFSNGTGTNDGTAVLYRGRSAGGDRFYVYGNGNVVNTNGSYGTISDAKMKADIVDAGSQWNDIKAVRFRKFKMKDDPAGLVQLGVVAQELEQVSPGLVDEHTDRDAEGNDLGTTTKSVKTSVLLMKAAVALQEAMARIEKLEAEVAALKGA